MSTRACYRFFPLNGPNDWPGVVTVYKHMDGYPSGAAKAIEAALPYAWPLPRFDEFAAAFVRANKKSTEDRPRIGRVNMSSRQKIQPTLNRRPLA